MKKKRFMAALRAKLIVLFLTAFVFFTVLLFDAKDSLAQSSDQLSSVIKKRLGPVSVVQAKSPMASITSFGTEEGLALSSVYASYRDRKGNLWFGTYGGGVSKYDGRAFQNYSTSHGLSHNMVVSICEDRYGDMWFGTFGGGVSRFDGNIFETLTKEQGLAQNMVLSILEDSKGNLWFGTFEGGVSRYDGKSFQNYSTADGLADNKIWCITEDAHGNIYFGTDKGASTFDGKAITLIPETSGKVVHSIFIDSKQAVWIGTESDGIFHLINSAVRHFTVNDGLSDQSIWQIMEDKKGVIWIGTERGGAVAFDGEQFSALTITEGLSHNTVRSITEDNHGSLWFGTYGGGINRYDGNLVSSYNTPQGLSSGKIRSIFEDHQGNLWFSTLGGGLNKFNGQTFQQYTMSTGLPSNQIRTAMETRDHTIWIGTHGAGLTKFDGSAFATYDQRSGLPDNNVRAIYEDASGKLWVGTDGGLALLDAGLIKIFRTDDGLAHNRVWNILQDKNGNFWFGTYGGGVSFYDGKHFKNYTAKDGLCNNSILCLFEDSSRNIWFGGVGGGLTRFDGQDFLTITPALGLTDETVYDILESPDGKLWIGTNLGITALLFLTQGNELIPGGKLSAKNAELKNYTCQWEAYNTLTGHPIKDINTNAMCIAQIGFGADGKGKGMIWAGCGDDKVIRLNPLVSRTELVPPTVILKNLKVNDEALCWYSLQGTENVDSADMAHQEMIVYGKTLSQKQRDGKRELFKGLEFRGVTKFVNLPTGLSLSNDINRITFEFNAIEPSRYFLVNYQYRLEGQDAEWSPVLKSSAATYSNLWEGSYAFMVRAQGADGLWSEPVVYNFNVMPPWWREPWMYIVYFGSLVAFIIAVVKFRELGLKREKVLLESIIADRTADAMDQMKSAELQKREAQKQRAEAERHRSIVEQKNKEISVQLTGMEANLSNLTLQMIQRYHSFSEIEAELRKLADVDDARKFQRIFSLLATNKSLDKDWEQFNIYFNSLYENFNGKLREKSSQLSAYDLRMCALIKMGMQNREIAMLLNIEVNSVKMAKYRLKKKLMVDESVDLTSYFETL